MDVAVCGYDCELMEQIVAQVRLFACDMNETTLISCFFGQKDMLMKSKAGMYDIIFVDVSEDGAALDGLMRLRNKERGSLLVLISDEPLSTDAVKLSCASDVIIKPFSLEKIRTVLDIVLRHRRRGLAYRYGGSLFNFSYDDIVFIESRNNVCEIHTVFGGCYKIARTIKALSETLGEPFLHCHRSYLVNMDHIRSATTDFEMCTGDRVLITQRCLRDVKDRVMDYYSRARVGAGYLPAAQDKNSPKNK